jgi:hypothetical protein
MKKPEADMNAGRGGMKKKNNRRENFLISSPWELGILPSPGHLWATGTA